MLERRGYISVVASTASFAALPGMSSYNASKAGVELFVRALRQEVGFRGVDAGTVHPSWIDTDLVRESERDLASFRERRAKLPWPTNSTTSVETCAVAIVDGFEKRSARVFVPRAIAAALLAAQPARQRHRGAGDGGRCGGDGAARWSARSPRSVDRAASARSAINDLPSSGMAAAKVGDGT